ncbi:restriction endonuclease [Micromonospora sp. H61]|nr:restriction endonuclease [Micromonospora sp. H61]
MIRPDVLAGYLLEEFIASLIQSSGYRLLVQKSQDRFDLKESPRTGDLLVRGRGGDHQVDVLGEFSIVPAFSQPLRLFVEAKARGQRVGLPALRNAVGTLNDVNEAWMVGYSKNRVRRLYRYGLFSTSGFSAPAQDYALAHQINIVDLSGPEWSDFVSMVMASAEELVRVASRHVDRFPIRSLRRDLRLELGTMPRDATINLYEDDLGGFDIQDSVMTLKTRFGEVVNGALLAFPAGHQVLLVRPDNLEMFLAFAIQNPTHRVSLSVDRRHEGELSRTWVIRPIGEGRERYSLRLTLPTSVEKIALAETDRLAQSLAAKGELGGHLDIYWDPHGQERFQMRGPRLFRLRFAGSDLRQRRPDLT